MYDGLPENELTPRPNEGQNQGELPSLHSTSPSLSPRTPLTSPRSRYNVTNHVQRQVAERKFHAGIVQPAQVFIGKNKSPLATPRKQRMPSVEAPSSHFLEQDGCPDREGSDSAEEEERSELVQRRAGAHRRPTTPPPRDYYTPSQSFAHDSDPPPQEYHRRQRPRLEESIAIEESEDEDEIVMVEEAPNSGTTLPPMASCYTTDGAASSVEGYENGGFSGAEEATPDELADTSDDSSYNDQDGFLDNTGGRNDPLEPTIVPIRDDDRMSPPAPTTPLLSTPRALTLPGQLLLGSDSVSDHRAPILWHTSGLEPSATSVEAPVAWQTAHPMSLRAPWGEPEDSPGGSYSQLSSGFMLPRPEPDVENSNSMSSETPTDTEDFVHVPEGVESRCEVEERLSKAPNQHFGVSQELPTARSDLSTTVPNGGGSTMRTLISSGSPWATPRGYAPPLSARADFSQDILRRRLLHSEAITPRLNGPTRRSREIKPPILDEPITVRTTPFRLMDFPRSALPGPPSRSNVGSSRILQRPNVPLPTPNQVSPPAEHGPSARVPEANRNSINQVNAFSPGSVSRSASVGMSGPPRQSIGVQRTMTSSLPPTLNRSPLLQFARHYPTVSLPGPVARQREFIPTAERPPQIQVDLPVASDRNYSMFQGGLSQPLSSLRASTVRSHVTPYPTLRPYRITQQPHPSGSEAPFGLYPITVAPSNSADPPRMGLRPNAPIQPIVPQQPAQSRTALFVHNGGQRQMPVTADQKPILVREPLCRQLSPLSPRVMGPSPLPNTRPPVTRSLTSVVASPIQQRTVHLRPVHEESPLLSSSYQGVSQTHQRPNLSPIIQSPRQAVPRQLSSAHAGETNTHSAGFHRLNDVGSSFSRMNSPRLPRPATAWEARSTAMSVRVPSVVGRTYIPPTLPSRQPSSVTIPAPLRGRITVMPTVSKGPQVRSMSIGVAQPTQTGADSSLTANCSSVEKCEVRHPNVERETLEDPRKRKDSKRRRRRNSSACWQRLSLMCNSCADGERR